MSPQNDILERSDEIRTLIASNDIFPAVKRLMDFVQDFSTDNGHRDEVTVISADLREFEAERRREEWDYQEARKVRRKLLFTMLDLMNSVTADPSLEIGADA